jgi:hypothetical protein
VSSDWGQKFIGTLRDREHIYLAQQFVDVPMVLRNAFNKLIKSLNEISNLISVSIVKGAQPRTAYILATKIETL